MNENLIAITAREIVFGLYDDTPARRLIRTRRLPAGTQVYAHVRSDGTIRIRIPCSLLTQDVDASAIDVP